MSTSRLQHLIDYSPRQLAHLVRRKLFQQPRRTTFDEKHPCIFVLSTGRTGTETLATLLGLSGKVFSYHEPHPKLYALSQLLYLRFEEYMLSESLQSIFHEAFLTARRDLFDYSLICGRGYIETSPQVTFLAPAIAAAVPSVRFIHIVRDPRNVVRSGMRRKWYDGHRNDETRIFPRAGTEEEANWSEYSPFQKNLWLWTETNRWILNYLDGIPTDRKITIQSEKLFANDRETLEKLFAIRGGEAPSQKSIAKVLQKRLNAQMQGSFPEASDWPIELYENFTRIAGDTAKQFGYSL